MTARCWPRIARGLGVFLLLSAGCGNPTAVTPNGAPLRLTLSPSAADDPRTYSVGRVQLRALDAEGILVAAEIFAIDRTTGHFDLEFVVPAGDAMTLLVEPLGSALLPDGGKTESAIALQAVARPLSVVAEQTLEVEATLEPFIPDSLAITSLGEELDLSWKQMAIATGHRVRVIEIANGEIVSRTVAVTNNRIRVDDLRSNLELEGFQVQSINQFASSAFSDTLFWEFAR